jgi:hypothetical protein
MCPTYLYVYFYCILHTLILPYFLATREGISLVEMQTKANKGSGPLQLLSAAQTPLKAGDGVEGENFASGDFDVRS